MSNPFKTASDASKLSIPQLQQALQHGTVPPYIGIPLLQDMVQKSKQSQAMAGGQQKPPTVAEQVMAEAQQVGQGVPSLSTNLPVSMAGGGIVAFAEGGMYDDEDTDEDRIDAARSEEINSLMDEYAQTFQGGIGQLPAAEKAVPADREGIAGGDAADFVARIMHKESRGRRYGKDGQLLTSEKGAQGEMQVMPGTSRDPGFGVKPARDDSPDELARVGRDYANTLLQRYGDPKLAAIAYNMGPSATDKWLASGADVSKLPRETQGYVKGFSGKDKDSQVKESGLWPYNAREAGKFSYEDAAKFDARKKDEELEVKPKGNSGIKYEPASAIGNVTPTSYKPKEIPETPLTAKEREAQIEADRIAMKRMGIGSLQPVAAAGDVLFGGPLNAASAGVSALANAVGVPRLGRAMGIYDKDVTSVDLPRIGSGTKTPFFDMLRQADANIGIAKPDTSATKTVSQVPAGNPDLLALDAQRRADAANKPAVTKISPYDTEDARAVESVNPAAQPAIATSQGAAKADPYAEFKDLFTKREENLAKQREQDKYMALLSAGLGMMGGTSPNALANIGAGAQQGIQSLAQSNAARTAEENALLSGRLGLAKIGGAKEQADAMMQLRRDLAVKSDERARDLASANLEEKQIRREEGSQAKALQRLTDISKNAEIQAEKAIAANPAVNFAQDREAKKQAMIADILRRNSAYAKTYQSVHGKDADPFEGLGGTMGGDYGSIPEGAVRKVK